MRMRICEPKFTRGGHAMTKDRDNRPYMDYEELRRRHELYKSRTRRAASQNTASVEVEEKLSRPTPRIFTFNCQENPFNII